MGSARTRRRVERALQSLGRGVNRRQARKLLRLEQAGHARKLLPGELAVGKLILTRVNGFAAVDPVPGSTLRPCDQCREECWISPDSVAQIIATETLCTYCAEKKGWL